MRQWFLTTAILTVSCLSVSIFCSFIAFYFTVKSSLRTVLLRFYPEAKKFQVRKNQAVLKKNIFKNDISQEQTDDPFTSGDESSDEGKVSKGETKKNLPERIIVFIFKALVY